MRDKFIKFMYGRYGVDELNKSAAVFAIILSILGMFFNGWISFILSSLSFFTVLMVVFRTFSRNINKRVMENHKFLAKTNKIRSWLLFTKTRFNDRKLYRYIKCPNCKNYSRVPKGKGKIKITCRVCKKQFDKKV
ncbi:MAG: hypothetical protein E7365_04810 [Clostridiales bacterium]|nr:hypothetical protein [Clostridiales bacterium]